MSVCVPQACQSLQRSEEALDPLELESHAVVSHSMWVLGTQHGSFERTGHVGHLSSPHMFLELGFSHHEAEHRGRAGF